MHTLGFITFGILTFENLIWITQLLKNLHWIIITFWKFTTYTLYFTMEEEFKKDLTTLWERGGVKFNNLNLSHKNNVTRLLKIPPRNTKRK